MLKIGDVVKYVDGERQEHSALVIHVWNENYLNLAYCSPNPTQDDSYGRQLLKETSVYRLAEFNRAGRYFTT